MKQTHTNDGYTLIELLLYIAMTAVLLTGLMAFFGMTLSVRVKNESMNEVEQQGQFVLSTLLQSVRNAESITTPAVAASSTSMTLTTADSATNPTVYSISGTSLQIKEGTSAAINLTNNNVAVTNFMVKNASRTSSSGSVEISFTLSTLNTTGRNEYDYQKSFVGAASIR